ncbi:hypothetical protein ANANG_G00221550 [Anguilla anguilla]|uniref:Uncharacterized protein n=1 Tax=Anguilla anguilla TaxID=7936 RepID=A0A9D3RPL2_ANGAN|nr:hypothetical protein ANANG_G00221550 [Anguilla anguilla]
MLVFLDSRNDTFENPVFQMEANNQYNFGGHPPVSANSGLKPSSGESLYTNGSSMSFSQQGKNLNGDLNVNGITTVAGTSVAGPHPPTSYSHMSGHHQHHSSLGYDYLWGPPQYSPATGAGRGPPCTTSRAPGPRCSSTSRATPSTRPTGARCAPSTPSRRPAQCHLDGGSVLEQGQPRPAAQRFCHGGRLWLARRTPPQSQAPPSAQFPPLSQIMPPTSQSFTPPRHSPQHHSVSRMAPGSPLPMQASPVPVMPPSSSPLPVQAPPVPIMPSSMRENGALVRDGPLGRSSSQPAGSQGSLNEMYDGVDSSFGRVESVSAPQHPSQAEGFSHRPAAFTGGPPGDFGQRAQLFPSDPVHLAARRYKEGEAQRDSGPAAVPATSVAPVAPAISAPSSALPVTATSAPPAPPAGPAPSAPPVAPVVPAKSVAPVAQAVPANSAVPVAPAVPAKSAAPVAPAGLLSPVPQTGPAAAAKSAPAVAPALPLTPVPPAASAAPSAPARSVSAAPPVVSAPPASSAPPAAPPPLIPVETQSERARVFLSKNPPPPDLSANQEAVGLGPWEKGAGPVTVHQRTSPLIGRVLDAGSGAGECAVGPRSSEPLPADRGGTPSLAGQHPFGDVQAREAAATDDTLGSASHADSPLADESWVTEDSEEPDETRNEDVLDKGEMAEMGSTAEDSQADCSSLLEESFNKSSQSAISVSSAFDSSTSPHSASDADDSREAEDLGGQDAPDSARGGLVVQRSGAGVEELPVKDTALTPPAPPGSRCKLPNAGTPVETAPRTRTLPVHVPQESPVSRGRSAAVEGGVRTTEERERGVEKKR